MVCVRPRVKSQHVRHWDSWRRINDATYARRLLWSALTGICGQGLFLLGFILPYATLSTGQQRWFLTVTWGTLLTTLQQGDYSVLFWAVLIMGPCALYLGILLDAGRVTRRRHLWVASTILITGLTFVAGSLLLILDVFILFYNAPHPSVVSPSTKQVSRSLGYHSMHSNHPAATDSDQDCVRSCVPRCVSCVWESRAISGILEVSKGDTEYRSSKRRRAHASCTAQEV